MTKSGVRVSYANVSGLIRCYDKSAATLGDYKAVISISWTGRNSAFLFGANGKMGRDDLLEIAHLLLGMGVIKVMMERQAGRMMPGARLVETVDGLSLWSIDDINSFVKLLTRPISKSPLTE